MKTSDGQVNSIVINQAANSLYALIADGAEKRFTKNLGRHTWKKLIGNQASLQRNCNREGFNLKSPNYHSEARIGIISNQENDCASPDSRIGFGTGGYPNGHNTCGNVASAIHHPDNGGKDIRAMGYILVQWVSNNLVPVQLNKRIAQNNHFYLLSQVSIFHGRRAASSIRPSYQPHHCSSAWSR